MIKEMDILKCLSYMYMYINCFLWDLVKTMLSILAINVMVDSMINNICKNAFFITCVLFIY